MVFPLFYLIYRTLAHFCRASHVPQLLVWQPSLVLHPRSLSWSLLSSGPRITSNQKAIYFLKCFSSSLLQDVIPEDIVFHSSFSCSHLIAIFYFINISFLLMFCVAQLSPISQPDHHSPGGSSVHILPSLSSPRSGHAGQRSLFM